MRKSETAVPRRRFIAAAAAGMGAAACASLRAAGAPVPRRPFGRRGETVSILGVGGHHLGRAQESEAVRIVHEALDAGANFFDNAWEYHRGHSEEILGKALAGRRHKAFVMTKHHGRDKKTAMKHLEDSLRRLRTDFVDLWMFHECVYHDDPDMIFAPGGGIKAAELAKKQGKVRYIGFTGHKWPRIHLKMLAYDYPWDAVLMPLNVLDGTFRSFEKWVLPVLLKRGIAPLAMKTRASGIIVRQGIATAEECWRYVLSLPVATIVSGMESLQLLRQNLHLARTCKPMTAKERKAIRSRTQSYAEAGTYEPFKTTNRFDGPEGRKLHGL